MRVQLPSNVSVGAVLDKFELDFGEIILLSPVTVEDLFPTPTSRIMTLMKQKGSKRMNLLC